MKYYGLHAIRRSFVHFTLGKSISAASSLVILVIIVRQLSVAEFAVYTSMHALALIIGLLSSFGVNAILLRFLPELRAAGNNRAMYRLFLLGITLRAVLYAISGVVILQFADALGVLLKLGDWAWLLPAYLVVGFFRINATFTVGVLESLLWQREAQYGVAVATLMKLAAVLALFWYDRLSLELFILVEAIAELCTLMFLLGSAFFRWSRDRERAEGDAGVLVKDARRYLNYALWTYSQHLTSILNGSAPNRLFISYFLPVSSIALFGVVDRLITFVRQYEPLQTFVGMVRPIFNSRYTEPADFPKLLSLADFLFRINLVVLIVPFLAFAIAGHAIFDWLTRGTYVEAATLFLAFYTIVIVSSVNLILDMLAKMVEHTRIYTLSNLVLSASICLAIPLIPRLGLWSLALANGMGMVLSITIVMVYLKRVGFRVAFNCRLIARIASFTLGAVALGHLLLELGLPTVLSVLVAYAAYFLALYCWPPLLQGERALIDKVLLAGRQGRFAKVSSSSDF